MVPGRSVYLSISMANAALHVKLDFYPNLCAKPVVIVIRCHEEEGLIPCRVGRVDGRLRIQPVQRGATEKWAAKWIETMPQSAYHDHIVVGPAREQQNQNWSSAPKSRRPLFAGTELLTPTPIGVYDSVQRI